MVKKAQLKQEFERLVSCSGVLLPNGRRDILSREIRVVGVLGCKSAYLALVVFVDGCDSPVTLERSYPMSFASAWRLACSL